MSRRSSRHSSTYEDSDVSEDDRKPAARVVNMSEDEEEEEDPRNNAVYSQVQFTQQEPEPSQPMVPIKTSERNKWNNMHSDTKNKLVTDLTRLILFKGVAGESIDKRKCAKEALGDYASERITESAFEEAATRLHNIFGFELRRAPAYMDTGNQKGGLPTKYKDRLFLINGLEDEEGGGHSKAIHSVHSKKSMAKGLLMLVLAFCYCKGERRNDGSRWIRDVDLYVLLNGLDENIPAEPPVPSSRKQDKKKRYAGNDTETPNVDDLLDKFVHQDYLLKEKQQNEAGATQTQTADEVVFLYAMGPRAALEIGRRQVIFFCAEVLDEEPDPAMLAEIEEEEDDGEMVAAED